MIENLDDLFIASVANRAQKGCRQKLPAAFAPIQIDVKEIISIKLYFQPGTAIRNDAETIKDFPVKMDRRFKGYARRTMQLAHYHSLGSVDYEGALRSHERDLAHIDFLLFRALFIAQLKGDV